MIRCDIFRQKDRKISHIIECGNWALLIPEVNEVGKNHIDRRKFVLKIIQGGSLDIFRVFTGIPDGNGEDYGGADVLLGIEGDGATVFCNDEPDQGKTNACVGIELTSRVERKVRIEYPRNIIGGDSISLIFHRYDGLFPAYRTGEANFVVFFGKATGIK